MAERVRMRKEGGAEAPSAFFGKRSDTHQFFSTGCKVLDCVIGGGWVLGRIANVIGDKATGKSLLAIEACANFAHTYPKGKIYYREAEAAFDQDYAGALGMPIERIDFGDEDAFRTVEDFYEDLNKVLDKLPKGVPALYIVDSLDALSDAAEMARDFDKESYGGTKPKQMGALFRRLVQKIEDSMCCVIIISQVRDKIGITFGRQQTRSGGRALDFYASQVVWLTHLKRINKTVHKIQRVVAVQISAKCEKNKIGLPFRSCDFEISFGYGIDDVGACMGWLADANKAAAFLDGQKASAYLEELDSLRGEEHREAIEELHAAVETAWYEIEKSFLPARRKYGD